MKSPNQLQNDINIADCDLRRAESRMAEFHQELADLVVTKLVEVEDRRWDTDDEATVDVTVSVPGRLLRDVLDAQSDVTFNQDVLRSLRLQMADVLERQASELRKLAE